MPQVDVTTQFMFNARQPLIPGSFASQEKISPILGMTLPDPISPSPMFVSFWSKILLVVYIQLLVPGSLADLVVKENDFADLQLDRIQSQAELVEDKTLPLECRRQVIKLAKLRKCVSR